MEESKPRDLTPQELALTGVSQMVGKTSETPSAPTLEPPGAPETGAKQAPAQAPPAPSKAPSKRSSPKRTSKR